MITSLEKNDAAHFFKFIENLTFSKQLNLKYGFPQQKNDLDECRVHSVQIMCRSRLSIYWIGIPRIFHCIQRVDTNALRRIFANCFLSLDQENEGLNLNQRLFTDTKLTEDRA